MSAPWHFGDVVLASTRLSACVSAVYMVTGDAAWLCVSGVLMLPLAWMLVLAVRYALWGDDT